MKLSIVRKVTEGRVIPARPHHQPVVIKGFKWTWAAGQRLTTTARAYHQHRRRNILFHPVCSSPLVRAASPFAVSSAQAPTTRIFFNKRSSAHATARLTAPAGIILAKAAGKYLINNEPVHVLVAAPTRAGKGVDVVIPNLLAWPGSVVVLDIKKENYGITAGYRSQHSPVFLWAPMDQHSHKYNPLDLISPDPDQRVTDLQKLATILIPHSGRGETMWVEEARQLFIGLTLLVLGDPQAPHTIGHVYHTLMSENDLAAVITASLDQQVWTIDPLCRRLLANFKNKASKERSGVKSNLTAALSLWANPNIDAATSASDFDLRDFRRNPTAVYVGVGQDQLLTLAPLLNLFFQQAVAELSKALPGKDEPYQVLFLVDEFAMLGAMPTLATGLALLAGYNIRILLIIQGLGQLEEIYNKTGSEGILQNCALQMYFASNDDTTTQYISNRLGNKTISVKSLARTQKMETTTHTNYIARPLLPPDEVRRLNEKKAIIFKEAVRPVLANKIRYYKEKPFLRRLFDAPAVPALAVAPPPPDIPVEVSALNELIPLLEYMPQTAAAAKPPPKQNPAPPPTPAKPPPKQNTVFDDFREETLEEESQI